ncbi:ABC transporter, ATP-binding protein [Liquorilactobacillus aquaticus DSM 21051]|uniref:ABC transporter, ATP-binding protein n=1 Tax=Liquorilactobacillus aquaticus DSM 21051 TaxID=1423725 RepID=A0A0R2CXP1_9LACO|nr:ABC transporter ATP-binding protein [Liquorilactobacillus aquaticus]KRM96637.1 ABC transporter, ATP-binding protein [Liquorilactobacillus aquaticus DSM 21051]
MTLKINGLVGGYSQVPVLKNISFEVRAGEVVGLIGLNGAGKSTTINHVIGLLTPQKGSIIIDGATLMKDPETYKSKMAYIPEIPVLYQELTLREHIDLTIMAYGLNKGKAWLRAESLLKMFRLSNKLEWFPANFSKGMKQKVMIVCAFLTEAELYVIDEPFLGLDPLATRDLLNLIQSEKKRGAAVLMSTHVLSTAQEHCDYFVLLHEGKIKTQGTFEELRNVYQNQQATLTDIYLGLTQEVTNHG